MRLEIGCLSPVISGTFWLVSSNTVNQQYPAGNRYISQQGIQAVYLATVSDWNRPVFLPVENERSS